MILENEHEKVNSFKSKKSVSKVIAIGSSAGGLQALKTFFSNVPNNSKHSYVIIQHLSPDFESLMSELLKKDTSLPITEVVDDTELEPGHIYLISPKKNLRIIDKKMRLFDKPFGKSLNLPIDIFFKSLALNYQENAIGIILSGTGSDGSKGIQDIKEYGGLVVVQKPETAAFEGMPSSAISTGYVDLVLPIEKMNDELEFIFKQDEIFKETKSDDFSDYQLTELMKVVFQHSKLDFSNYKASTISRRISRRVAITNTTSLNEYINFLKDSPEEVEILVSDFLIGVTDFYRDSFVWEELKKTVIPDLVKKTNEGETLKIWDVACSTGEEPYSLAISLNEELIKQGKKIHVKIFATDISRRHIDRAAKGLFNKEALNTLTEKLRDKYFQLDEGGKYKISPEIRKMVIFSQHDVLRDPPFSKMDMVMCRNVLIYFQSDEQDKAIKLMHYSLNFNGYLVLGTSESLGINTINFKDLNRKCKIFRNTSISNSSISKKIQFKGNSRNESNGNRIIPINSLKNTRNSQNRAVIDLSETVLDHFGAASVFVDDQFDIVNAIGPFKKYVNLPDSGFTTNLLQMLNTDVKQSIQLGIARVSRDNNKVLVKDIYYIVEDQKKLMDIIIKPIVNTEVPKINYSITFIEKELQNKDQTVLSKEYRSENTNDQLSELESQLLDAKENLNSLIEENEASNEELQASNEELMASNEELQCTNEELQSVNEELHTVNAELVEKVEDLANLNADVDNLLRSTNIGTIFVDGNYRIRKFTPAIKLHFDIINSDIGRKISNFSMDFGDNSTTIIDKIKQVVKTRKTYEKKFKNSKDKHYLMRINSYLNSAGEYDGVTISFIDISKIELSNTKLKESEQKFKKFYEKDPVMHFSVDPNTGLVKECNETAVIRLGYTSKNEILEKPVFDLYDSKSKEKSIHLINKFAKDGFLESEEITMVTKNGEPVPVILNSDAIKNEDGVVVRSRSTAVDISALKKIENELKEERTNLIRVNNDLEQFVSLCSHDLQEPLGTITFTSDMLNEIYGEKLDEKGKEYISYINDAAHRLSNQIKALLEHSRIGRNAVMEKVDLKEVLEVVKYDLGATIKKCGAKIYSGKLPTINGFKVELRLLFQNLIGNAIKYCKPNCPPEIRISCYKDGDFWIFSILDNGIGINETDQKAVFDIFNRAPGAKEFEGTGVGLAHCVKIVNLHGGSIWVDSQEGVGSTFQFKLKDQ